MDLPLSIAMSDNPRTRPVLEGKVKADGIALTCTSMHPSEMFWRQLRFAEFDVSEMSLSALMMEVAAGDDRWVGIPIFTTRKMFQVGVLVRKDRGIEVPADLKGKKMGVPEYQQTAALWTRGALQHEFGVHQSEMEHWMERVPTHSHGGATGFKPPPGTTVNQIPIEKSLGQMMVSGELQATIHYLRDNNLVDRSRIDLDHHPDIKTLFPDPIAEGVRYHKKTGIFPINHGMVIRREIAEKHPWTVLNLLKAYDQANEIANRQRIAHFEYHVWTGLISADAGKALREPAIRHGIKANRKTLETAAVYSHEQGLTPRLMKLEELFAPSAMEQ